MFRNAVAHKFQQKVSTCNSGLSKKKGKKKGRWIDTKDAEISYSYCRTKLQKYKPILSPVWGFQMHEAIWQATRKRRLTRNLWSDGCQNSLYLLT